MSLLGLSPLGTELGPWGGPGLITILGVLPVAMNQISIVFDRPVRARNDAAFDDGCTVDNFILTGIDPTIYPQNGVPFIPKGKFKPTRELTPMHVAPADDDPTQLILTTDAPLERLCEYELSVLDLRGDDGETFAGPTEWPLKALSPSIRPVRLTILEAPSDPYLDIANGYYPGPGNIVGITGWELAENLDWKKHGGVASAKKRIARRILSGRGKFLIYGARYGVEHNVKGLLRPGELQRLANDVLVQVRLEPDVVQAEVTATADRNSVDITVRAVIQSNTPVVVRQIVAF